MLKRLALVAWWLGTLLGGLLAMSGPVGAIAGHEGGSVAMAAAFVAMGCAVAAGFWAVAFVLAGSFWKPPRIGA